MKRIIALFSTAAVLFAGASLFAADAPKADQKPMCCMFMENNDLQLTPAQKEKAKALHAECLKDHCSADAQAKFFKEVKAMLTPEQMAACKASCEKKGIKGCPICGGAKLKD